MLGCCNTLCQLCISTIRLVAQAISELNHAKIWPGLMALRMISSYVTDLTQPHSTGCHSCSSNGLTRGGANLCTGIETLRSHGHLMTSIREIQGPPPRILLHVPSTQPSSLPSHSQTGTCSTGENRRNHECTDQRLDASTLSVANFVSIITCATQQQLLTPDTSLNSEPMMLCRY